MEASHALVGIISAEHGPCGVDGWQQALSAGLGDSRHISVVLTCDLCLLHKYTQTSGLRRRPQRLRLDQGLTADAVQSGSGRWRSHPLPGGGAPVAGRVNWLRLLRSTAYLFGEEGSKNRWSQDPKTGASSPLLVLSVKEDGEAGCAAEPFRQVRHSGRFKPLGTTPPSGRRGLLAVRA
jgi:hypothetical protein